MSHLLRRTAVIAVTAISSIGGVVALGAGPASAGPAKQGFVVHAASAGADALAKVKIVDTAKPVFTPTKVTGPVGYTADGGCDEKADGSFNLDNDTTATQTLTYEGSPAFDLAPGKYYVCVAVAGVYKFGLSSNVSAKLKAKIS